MSVRICLLTCVMALGRVAFAADAPPPPVSLVFDTDIGNDVDDAMALSMIHALAGRGECRLLAVTITKDNTYAAPLVDLWNTFYGRPEIPIGMVRQGMAPEDGKYLRQVVTAEDAGKPRYAHKLQSGSEVPEAVALLRKVLAGQPDGSVVMVQVGFSTNLARLLESRPDAASPLPGVDLVKAKVRLLSTMAGAFGEKMRGRKEYNIIKDLPASTRLFAQWPTPIVASGWEIGNAIKHPSASMRQDYRYLKHHPLVEAYGYYRGLANDQPTYDLTSVLYAVRPERGYFSLSAPGRIVVNPDGTTDFRESPDGPHRYLLVTPEQVAQVREAQVMLCSEPPKK